MAYVRVDHDIGRKVALMFGPEATRPFADKVHAKAMANATARATHSSVADRIDISVRPTHAQGWRVAMSVTGRDGSQVAAHLEFGYFNVRAGRHLPGKHIMRDAV